jgi:hypothetical protein
MKLQSVVRRFSKSFALRPASRVRMFGAGWPLESYSAFHDFIGITGAEALR